jgi:hypothetical protein
VLVFCFFLRSVEFYAVHTNIEKRSLKKESRLSLLCFVVFVLVSSTISVSVISLGYKKYKTKTRGQGKKNKTKKSKKFRFGFYKIEKKVSGYRSAAFQ